MCCWVRARPGSPGLERTVPAVAFIEDANIAASGEPITEVAQFLERSRRVRQHVILKLGVSAVFELAANPVAGPTWVRSVYEAAGADHLLHMLDTPVDECRRRSTSATQPSPRTLGGRPLLRPRQRRARLMVFAPSSSRRARPRASVSSHLRGDRSGVSLLTVDHVSPQSAIVTDHELTTDRDDPGFRTPERLPSASRWMTGNVWS